MQKLGELNNNLQEQLSNKGSELNKVQNTLKETVQKNEQLIESQQKLESIYKEKDIEIEKLNKSCKAQLVESQQKSENIIKEKDNKIEELNKSNKTQ
jgi:predicted nuclease with TOPRIM domain